MEYAPQRGFWRRVLGAGVVVIVMSGTRMGSGAAEAPVSPTPPPRDREEWAQRKAEAAAIAANPGRLAGTSWRLVEFQSMSEEMGGLRPEKSQAYTMRLHRDGRVSMQLNCNRGHGAWSAEASEDAASGRFEFGPLAMTRARCPPPGMDERIAADAAHVRGYLLKGRRLYLSLMADAGVYVWERAAESDENTLRAAFAAERDTALEAALCEESPGCTSTVERAGRRSACR